MRTPVKYKAGYKYQLSELYLCKTEIYPPEHIHTQYISLLKDGTLICNLGYAWDGPSGPTFDTPEAMAASLPHDAGYQLIHEGHLDDSYKEKFDTLLKQIMVEDSSRYHQPLKALAKLRASYFFDGVSIFGGKYLYECKKEITIYPF